MAEINPLYAPLKVELGAAGYVGMSDADIAAAINAKTVAGRAPIPGDAVQAFFMRRAIIGKCRVLSMTESADMALRVFCANICDSFANNTFAAFDLDDTAAKADCDTFTDALVTAEIMTAAQRDELYALADTVTPWTMANMGLPNISEYDVAAARAL